MASRQPIIISVFDINLKMRTISLLLSTALAAGILFVPASQAQTFTVLHELTSSQGSLLVSGLSADRQGNLYGAVGWTFWRCFASTWSLRKDEVFGELMEQLAAMGIEPLGALERVPSLVEKRTWVPANFASGHDEVQTAIDSVIGGQQPSIA